jgi:hypothetical protein
MKFFSHLTSRFKASVPPTQEEIEQRLRRLNALLLAYRQVKTMTVTAWMATER